MKKLRSLSNLIARGEKALLFAMLFSIVGVNLMQIGLRMIQSLIRTVGSDFVLSAPSWPADLNRVLVLWIAMVGGSLATQYNEHIKVDFLSRLLKGKSRFLVNGLISLVGIVVCLMLVFFSIQFLKMEYELEETLVAIPIPLWIIQIIIPAGFTIIAFRFFLQLVEGPGMADDPLHEKEPDGNPGDALEEEGGEPC